VVHSCSELIKSHQKQEIMVLLSFFKSALSVFEKTRSIIKKNKMKITLNRVNENYHFELKKAYHIVNVDNRSEFVWR
jgi:hypothetical protein